MIHRTTFTLDDRTIQTIKQLASLWQVPQAEVIRRSVASAAHELNSRKQVIQNLRDYWEENVNRNDNQKLNQNSKQEPKQNSPMYGPLEKYLLEAAEDRKQWRSSELGLTTESHGGSDAEVKPEEDFP